jgi:hypothetical protein
MTPPSDFVAKLERFDASLRLRWGSRTQLWIVERKMPPRHKQLLSERPSPWKSERGLDLYDGWRDGYVHVISVHPTMLDERVFDALREADTWRQGGMEALAQKLDDLDAAEEAQTDRAVKNFVESAASEAYDRLKWLQKERVAVSTPEPQLIDTGLGFKITDRRSVSA